MAVAAPPILTAFSTPADEISGETSFEKILATSAITATMNNGGVQVSSNPARAAVTRLQLSLKLLDARNFAYRRKRRTACESGPFGFATSLCDPPTRPNALARKAPV